MGFRASLSDGSGQRGELGGLQVVCVEGLGLKRKGKKRRAARRQSSETRKRPTIDRLYCRYSYPVEASNGLRMGRNLTGGLPVVYQGHLARLGHSENVQHPLTKRNQRGAPEEVGVPDCKTDNGENARMHETNTYAKEMHMMT